MNKPKSWQIFILDLKQNYNAISKNSEELATKLKNL